jgi:hypothetical protein
MARAFTPAANQRLAKLRRHSCRPIGATPARRQAGETGARRTVAEAVTHVVRQRFVPAGASFTYRAVDVNGNVEASHTISG